MPSDRDKAAARYRKLAAQCLEMAERMSLNTDRARMMEMAQRWLDLAKQAEERYPSR